MLIRGRDHLAVDKLLFTSAIIVDEDEECAALIKDCEQTS